VALIQSVLAALGFLVAGLPGAGLWAVVFSGCRAATGGNTSPYSAVIYVFATSSVTKAVIFMVWCLIVALVDNALKPLLLGRGVAVPIAVVFLGAIGGFVSMGLIGLFVGANRSVGRLQIVHCLDSSNFWRPWGDLIYTRAVPCWITDARGGNHNDFYGHYDYIS